MFRKKFDAVCPRCRGHDCERAIPGMRFDEYSSRLEDQILELLGLKKPYICNVCNIQFDALSGKIYPDFVLGRKWRRWALAAAIVLFALTAIILLWEFA